MTKTKDMKQAVAKATDTELAAMLRDTHATLRAERFAAAGARPKDSNSPAKLKKMVARILTAQHSRGSFASAAASASSASLRSTK